MKLDVSRSIWKGTEDGELVTLQPSEGGSFHVFGILDI